MSTAAKIEAGDWIAVGPFEGEVVEVIEHGRAIGDGTEDFFTFKVRPHGRRYDDVLGPLRASAQVAITRAVPD